MATSNVTKSGGSITSAIPLALPGKDALGSLPRSATALAAVSLFVWVANAGAAQLPNLVPEGWVQVYADIGTKTRRFVSPDGQSSLTSSESLAQRDALRKEMDRIAYRDGERITYQRRGGNWIAVSGYRGDRIFYRKSSLACGGTRWHIIELDYPIKEKRRMDGPVTQIAHDMTRYSADCAN